MSYPEYFAQAMRFCVLKGLEICLAEPKRVRLRGEVTISQPHIQKKTVAAQCVSVYDT